MTTRPAYINPSEAARRLGVSAKTLRHYEKHGLLAPLRTEAGWRAYGPDDVSRAADIVALRRLGLGLAQISGVLDGDDLQLDRALAAHLVALEAQARALAGMIEQVRRMRSGLSTGTMPGARELMQIIKPQEGNRIEFDLPWPWDGERFQLSDIQPMMFITGPLGSGKTRLARCIAQACPGGEFLGAERIGGALSSPQCADAAHVDRVQAALDWLADEGATISDALRVLIALLEAERRGVLVVDMLEEGLDMPTQIALMAYLRYRSARSHPLFILTRSSSVLDLELVGRDEGILFCPANHSPPMRVAPFHGAPGYESVATCVAPPDVRARTHGVVAWRPPAH